VTKPTVFVTRLIREAGLQLVREFCQADIWDSEDAPPRSALLERVRGVDGLLCLLSDRIDDELLDAAGPQLKVISNHAVGFDNIDVPATTRRGIPVGNTPGILTDATADFAFALLLAAGRRVVEAERYVRAGKWRSWGPSLLVGIDFNGATLGLIGYGRIGQAMARRAAGFGMRILYCDPNPAPAVPGVQATRVDLDTLLAESDFVSLHTPLTPATRDLMDAGRLAQMKPGAVLVNTARGAMVDQAALYQALKSGHLFAAALDVTDPEPLPLDSPLLTLENCIIAPHIASAGTKTRDRLAVVSVENLIAGLKGERLPFCVNPEVYSKA
jgi:lactate dehydrogenase-like 2-hydroxyacid dehydrogenase